MLRFSWAVSVVLCAISAIGCGGQQDSQPSKNSGTESVAVNGSSNREAVVSPSAPDETQSTTSLVGSTVGPRPGETGSGAGGEPVSDIATSVPTKSAHGTTAQPETEATGLAAGLPAPDEPAESNRPTGTRLPEDFLADALRHPLNPQQTVAIDVPGRRVFLKSRVCLIEGMLEMLLCRSDTKEHEAILAFDSDAYTVHAALLALGCREGTASRYDLDTETFHPPTGQTIDIYLHWVDEAGKLHREPAQSWVRKSRFRYFEAPFESLPEDLSLPRDSNLRFDSMNGILLWYGPMNASQRDELLTWSRDEKYQAAIRDFFTQSQAQQMAADWIFVGSGFHIDENQQKHYLAEGGYVICVANFPMAMIDVSAPSSSNGTESLSFEAWKERIPPIGSDVLVELAPRPAEPASIPTVGIDETVRPAAPPLPALREDGQVPPE